MEWESTGLFATPLIKIKIGDVAFVREFFFKNVVNRSEKNSNIEGLPEENRLDHFNNRSSVFNQYEELLWLKEKLESAATFAYQDLLNYKKSGPMNLTNAWFNLAQKGANQGKHSHANALLSGTLYLQTDEHSVINFYHPQTNSSMHAELHDRVDDSSANKFGLRYHHPMVMVKVNEGDCLLWPSYLMHGYENNQTENRLSLSFNLMPQYLNTIYQVS